MTADTRPIKIFYSYSHKDKRLRDKLETYLSALQQEGVIQEWHDGCIKAGQEWEPLIYQQLAAADLVLLLISPDFLQSEFCYRIEMEEALKRHKMSQVCVIPILLRPTDWEKSPFSKLQCLPADGKPVTRWHPQDEAFLDIVRGVRKIIEEWRPEPSRTTPSQTASHMRKKSHLAKTLHTSSNVSSFMQEVVCYNQGEYVQYQFLAGEFHKALRKSPRNAAVLCENCARLENFLNRNLECVAQRNFEHIITNYFHGRHDIDPRVCIKANSVKNGDSYILPVVRNKKVNYSSEYPINDNTGFKFVKKRGKYFLCNEIPESIVNGGYENERIDFDLARAYWEERKRQEQITSRDKDFQWDEAWIKCWKIPKHENGSPKEVDPISCYKSTLIIPMTLWNNKLDPCFLEKINIKVKEGISRTIFGYLCFDHVEENYFNDDVDIRVGYMFADILSLYMIARSTYTEFSETFLKARRNESIL